LRCRLPGHLARSTSCWSTSCFPSDRSLSSRARLRFH
jgi:hypothetical protein